MTVGYVAPASLDEALAFLAERGAESSILAGGMSVVPALKAGRLGSRFLMSIKAIGQPGDPEIDANGRCLSIGALVRHREIETSPLVAEHFPALRRLEERLASMQIRNHGTLVGNLCAAEPWSDPPCLLAALDTRLQVVSTRGQREVSAAEWIRGAGTTARAPDELVLRIELPLPEAAEGIGYTRVAARQGLARPLACAAARIALAPDRTVAAARVFVGALGPRPQRMSDCEAMLLGRRLDQALSAEIEQTVTRSVELAPDERCSATYKTQVGGVLVRRAIASAVEETGAGRMAA
jgi:carbon-monoxide dehydrogenase medium subunit